ncbi:hypothetical protein VE02_08530 [Pseudogymnoascus sp. 03VT05]|nr:hypothetical protein VE02_08530 [Pseudogymnoascus sp. 03VT05]
MKFNTMDNTSSGALITNTLALFSFLASVLASPISTPDAPNSLASKSTCTIGHCGLSGTCFKEGSCFGINIFNPDWSHCAICSCPGQAFGGRTDPTCIMDQDCLTVQLGTKPDPCAHKGHRYGGREASADPAPQRDGGVIAKYSTNPNIEAPANIPESIPFTNYLASRQPEGPAIDPDALEKLSEAKPESHILHERDELMKEYARLIDDGPGGPVLPDAAMMERLRSITHPEKRACYTVENGNIVSGACDTAENKIDIDSDVEADLKRRGGCFTVENGVIVEKRGGCGTVEPDVEAAVDPLAEGDPRDPLATVEKRVGCFVEEDGMVYAEPGCDYPDRGVGPPFPVTEGDP